VQPVLRGVFLKTGAGGAVHSGAYQRRYFEITWDGRQLKYGERPGHLEHQVDLGKVKRFWEEGTRDIDYIKKWKGRRIGLTASHYSVLTFVLDDSTREWHFAVPPEMFGDLVLWMVNSITKHSRHLQPG